MLKTIFSLKFLYIWLASAFGAICVLPYSLELMPAAFEQAATEMNVNVNVVLAISAIQSFLVLIPIVLIGLWATNKLKLTTPLFDYLINREPIKFNLLGTLKLSVLLGVISALFIILADELIFVSVIPELETISQTQPQYWKGLLASFYGGITEEIFLRFFLLSIIAVLICAVYRRISNCDEELPAKVFWLANISAALLFGIGHLPATAELLPLTPLIVTRALLLNGVVGLVAGVFFWKRGIEMAIVYHFTADITLHVIMPLVKS